MTPVFPTRETCNLDEPKEMFLPLLVALPMKDYSVRFPVVYLSILSAHLHECGAFMKCPQCGFVKDVVKQWQPPKSTTPHWLSDPGGWGQRDRPKANRSTKFDTTIPDRDQCDLADPRETFAWMLTGLPLMRGAPMLFDGSWAMDVSEHLHDGGAMVTCPQCSYAGQSVKEYVPPNLSGPHWLTDPGRWVPAGEKPPVSLEDEIDASLGKMSQRQQVELFKALEADEAGKPIPVSPAGGVVERMPADAKAAVLKRLRERDSA